MKGQTLYNRMVNLGVEPTKEQVVDWIDTWQKDIAAEAGPVGRHTFSNVTANVDISLPSDYSSLVEFLLDGNTYKRVDEVKIYEEGFISFPENLSQIIMRYRQIPQDYTNLNTELVVHKLLQPIAWYYLMSIYYDKEGEGDEESDMAARWMRNYEVKKNEILAKIANPNGMVPVATKNELPKYSRYHHNSLPEEDD